MERATKLWHSRAPHMEPGKPITDSVDPSRAALDGNTIAKTHSRLLALVFTDLVGSTGLKSELTTAGYLPLLRRHDELLRQAVAQANGSLQQDTGDGCFAVFATSSDAVRAALAFQWMIASEPWPAVHRLAARVGVHLGEVAETEVRQDGGQKLVGLAVDLAVRVMSLAGGGQILLMRGAFDDARQFVISHPQSDAAELKWLSHGPYLFKGTSEPLDVFEVGLDGRSPLSPPGDSEKARRLLRAGDEQTLGWRRAVARAAGGSFLDTRKAARTGRVRGSVAGPPCKSQECSRVQILLRRRSSAVAQA